MVPKEGAAGRLGGYILKVAGEIETKLNQKRQELCPWNHIGASYEEALAENRVSHRLTLLQHDVLVQTTAFTCARPPRQVFC
jgi:hypothetical protein